MKKIIIEIANIGDGFNSKLDTAEEKLRNLKDGSIENSQKYEDEKNGNIAKTIKHMETVKRSYLPIPELLAG